MDKFIPERETSHVAPGDVASRYSPAAYLTELWKNATTLHPANDPRSLSSRRPDIGQLVLSQDNMDKEVTTLELSNSLLIKTLRKDIHARYVILTRTPENTQDIVVSFNELEVITTDGVNIAPGADISSNVTAWVNKDGLRNLIHGNLDWSANSANFIKGNVWILLDLKKEYPIETIKLTEGRNGGNYQERSLRDWAIISLPEGALSEAVNSNSALMPSYNDLINTYGVYYHSWTTKNDTGNDITIYSTATSYPINTFTLTRENAAFQWDYDFFLNSKGYSHTLRGILSALPADEPGLFTDNNVANSVFSGTTPVTARYILIRRTPNNTVDTFMGFTGLKVLSRGVNIAPGKAVTSSTGTWYAGQEGHYLVDGEKYKNVASTATHVKGDCWFLVDLGTEYPIDSVVLYGRNNSSDAPNRERDMTLFALPASALPDNVATTTALMPSYDTLMNTAGVLSHTWATTNDDGQALQLGVDSTYTLLEDNHTTAAIWRMTQFHGVKKEDARVMCGKNISMAPTKNEVTGESGPSQFERLFGRQGETLLASTDLTEQRHILMSAFDVNDDGLALLTSLAGWKPDNKITLTQISALYAWVLLSRSLSYSLAELSILNSQVSVASVSGRYFAFLSAKKWLDEQQLSVTGLGVLTAPDLAMSGPVMDTLIDTLKREGTTKEGLTRHKLAEAVSATFGLSSGSQADTLLGWLDKHVPAGNMNSNSLIGWIGSSELNRTKKAVRYVMLRRKGLFELNEVKVLSGGNNVAKDKQNILLGPQGEYSDGYKKSLLVDEDANTTYAAKTTEDNSWVQIDLGQEYMLDSIELTPRSSNPERLADCYVYISDTDMAEWANSSKPGDTDSRYPWVGKTDSKVQTTAQSISLLYTAVDAALYLGRLLRYTLVANALNLTENTVAALVSAPAMLGTEGQLLFSLPRLKSLSQLLLLTRRCNTHAPAFLKQLSEKTLKLSDLAEYLSVDNTVLTAALPAGQKAEDILTFSTVVQLIDTLQLSQSTGFSLEGIKNLRSLSRSSPFTNWRTVATFLLNELPASARSSVQQMLSEERSLVLSKIMAQQNNTLPAGSLKKDADYFLIDPLLSGQTLTSPLAWSIAAVQLYIDRCLSGDELGINSVARDVQFFEDWDRYNKRYSQWAGLQQLLWEPENFISPSMRLSQTEAFSHLLQTLDGGVLNEDTAAEAFNSYLTEFEHLAEIIPVGGWHDSEDVDTGFTYLLGMMPGSSTEFYWRRLDRSKYSSNSAPIHAWSGWSKIDISATPLVKPKRRPAIGFICLNHRLRLLWVEAVEKNNSEKISIAGKTPDTLWEFTLKSSHLSYDGSWSTPTTGVQLKGLYGTSNSFKLEYDVVPDSNLIEINVYSLDSDGVNFSKVEHGTIDRNDVYTELTVNNDGSHLKYQVLSDNELSSQIILLDNDTFSVFVEFEDIRTSSLVYRVKGAASSPDGTNTSLKLTERFTDKLQLLDAMGIDALFTLQGYRQNSSELDFYGALGPYYWELFYHVPLVISQRMRQMQDYPSATRWQEFVFKPSGYKREITTAIKRKYRYVMLRRGVVDDYFAVKQIEILKGATNLATGSTPDLGDQGEYSANDTAAAMLTGTGNGYASTNSNTINAWVQIDLGGEYEIDTIRLTPRSTQLGFMTNCWVYVSDTDMRDWTKTSNAGDADKRYLQLGRTYLTNYEATNSPVSFSVAPLTDTLTSFDTSYWNPLPLEDDTDWGVDGHDVIPANVTDPDVIAEGDPMHYKLATFMSCLDLLIERGDTAYRQLERDTLVEAGMWYQKAQCLLGVQSLTPVSSTTLPVVSLATEADFNPQENEKLNGYWQQLRQRLYNLRHNLTLDGQPMNLPLFAKPANPADLLSAALAAANGIADLPGSQVGQLRFRPALEQARNLAGQLVQFGSTLLGITERQDAEAMNQMLQTQGSQLMTMSVAMQKRTLESLDADLAGLAAQRAGIVTRQAYYQALFEENISGNEIAALALNVVSAELLIAGGVSYMVGGGLSMAPNIFGVATGGSEWGGVANGLGSMLSNTASALSTTAGVLTQQDAFARRRGEWKLQLDSIKSELLLLDKQEESLTIRRDAADMQMTYLQTQQQQATLQLQLLKSKFTNQQLYSWMRSRLASIFWQFYDVAISAGLRAEKSYQFETGESSQRFIRPGNWQSSTGGLLCGESLLLDLARMEEAWYDWDKRTLEVIRTVSLASVINSGKLTTTSAVSGLADALKQKLDKKITGDVTWSRLEDNKPLKHELRLGSDDILTCDISLAELNISADYPSNLGDVRRIKSISVSLPALVGPYQDIQAVLRYTGDSHLPAGCEVIAVSHGVNDNGQFQLDFNDPRYLPFEGVDLATSKVGAPGTLNLMFPNASGKQKDLLKSLNDIILHIRYTIRH